MTKVTSVRVGGGGGGGRLITLVNADGYMSMPQIHQYIIYPVVLFLYISYIRVSRTWTC